MAGVIGKVAGMTPQENNKLKRLTMNQGKRARLEAAGWRVGTVAEMLKLTPEQEKLMEARRVVNGR